MALDSNRASIDEKTAQLWEANSESALDSLVDAIAVSIRDAEETLQAMSDDHECALKELRARTDQSIVDWQDKLKEYLPIDQDDDGTANRTTKETSCSIEASGFDEDRLDQTMDRLFPTECTELKDLEEKGEVVSMQSDFMNHEDGEKRREVLSVAEWQFPTKDLQKHALPALLVSPQSKKCHLCI